MAELQQNERLVINQLIDHGVFTSTPVKGMTKVTIAAIQSVKRPLVQQRINTYLKDLVGTGPENYQENLVFLMGKPKLDAETVHVLLATLKAVINLPEMQQMTSNCVVPTETIVRQVHSEVVLLDEKEIYRRITALFVDRFNLFTPDAPISQSSELPQEVTEFWDINPDFNYVAQCIVDDLSRQANQLSLTPVQEVNRALLIHQYISKSRQPELWQTLQTHKQVIADQWAQLQRYDLECGATYALLLDTQRQPVTARAFVVAIAVAQQLGVGVPLADLNDEIRKVTPQVLGKNSVTPTEVKRALLINGLVRQHNGFYVPTALVSRFEVATANEEDVVHADE